MITSAEEFVFLREHEDPESYRRAATEDAPEAVWEAVIETYPEMRFWVIHNKTVPLTILKRLARDSAVCIRAAVADKRKLDRELFDLLSKDVDESVRQRIAYNKKTPLDVLEQLSTDTSDLVASVAKDRLNGGHRGHP